jgi:hypothetical protein
MDKEKKKEAKLHYLKYYNDNGLFPVIFAIKFVDVNMGIRINLRVTRLIL